MEKFFEYPPPSGLSEGEERIVLEKGGETYSPPISYISLRSLGDVDDTGLQDGDTLIWSSLNQVFEMSAVVAPSIGDLGGVTLTSPIDGNILVYQTGEWVNSVPSSGNPFDQDLNTTNTPTFSRIIELGVIGDQNAYIGTDSGLYNTGTYNVAIGYSAGKGSVGLTDYYENIFIGDNAATAWQSGDENIIMGYEAASSTTSDSNNNIVFGSYAAYQVTDIGDQNIIMGYTAAQDSNNNLNQICIGEMTGLNVASGTRNVFIGYRCGTSDGVAGAGIQRNVFIGNSAGDQVRAGGNYNVCIGDGAGYRVNNGTNNVIIGKDAGSGAVSSSYDNCIIIGQNAGATLTTASNVICIGHGAMTSSITAINQMILGGTVNPVNVGINNNNPQYRIDVGGDINITGGYYVNGTPFVGGASRSVANIIAVGTESGIFNLPSTVTDIDNVDVWVNGIKLVRTSEYVLNGAGPTYTALTISDPTIVLNDDIEIITWE